MLLNYYFFLQRHVHIGFSFVSFISFFLNTITCLKSLIGHVLYRNAISKKIIKIKKTSSLFKNSTFDCQ